MGLVLKEKKMQELTGSAGKTNCDASQTYIGAECLGLKRQWIGTTGLLKHHPLRRWVAAAELRDRVSRLDSDSGGGRSPPSPTWALCATEELELELVYKRHPHVSRAHTSSLNGEDDGSGADNIRMVMDWGRACALLLLLFWLPLRLYLFLSYNFWMLVLNL